MGGMTRAVASGLPKRMIEEAATRRQAAVDMGEAVIVGVNRYRLESEDRIDSRDSDTKAVRLAQVSRLEQIRRSRDGARVAATLDALEKTAAGSGNILEAAVEAARARATVGEISDAMRRVFGDHSATPEVIGRVYGKAYEGEPEFQTLAARLEAVARKLGHKPRIMVAKLGQDGHDRGANMIASAFGDIGFDVLAGPLFQTPAEAASMAIDAQVRVLGVSSLAAGHKTLLPQLIEELKARGGQDIVVVCGGVVPRQDYQFLLDQGVAAVFGPGTNVLEAGRAVLDLMEGKRRND
jgi:methylmalonyl-CoA mutase